MPSDRQSSTKTSYLQEVSYFPNVLPAPLKEQSALRQGKEHLQVRSILMDSLLFIPTAVLPHAVLDVVVDDEIQFLVGEAVMRSQNRVDVIYGRLRFPAEVFVVRYLMPVLRLNTGALRPQHQVSHQEGAKLLHSLVLGEACRQWEASCEGVTQMETIAIGDEIEVEKAAV